MPPVSVEADQAIWLKPGPLNTVTTMGALGSPSLAAVRPETSELNGPCPPVFNAATDTKYVVPSDRPEIEYAREVPALLNLIGSDEAEVIFKEPQKAVTPGQAAVFYEDRTVVGGGTIESVYRDRF